jgi:small-conductance mechanosensitive channel
MILKHFGYDVMSLLTALGVGSLAVGLAAKDTLSNMISGFILIIDQNLKPGDRVNLGGIIGDVQEIGLRSTKIRLGDGNTLIVPNADLVNTKIVNLSVPSRSTSCSVQVRLPYSVPFSKVRELSLNLLEKSEKVSQEKPRWVNLNSLSEGHQLIQIGFWVSEMNDCGSVISEFNEQLLGHLQNENIPLVAPFQTISSQ